MNKELSEMFHKACEAIEAAYVPGKLTKIRDTDFDLRNKILKYDDDLDTAWNQTLKGNKLVSDFRSVLKKWYFLHIKIMKY